MFTNALDGYDVLVHPNVQRDDEQVDGMEAIGDVRDGGCGYGDDYYYSDGVKWPS